MALKAVLKNLDGVDDATKKLYVERDGKFILDVESVDGFALEDVGGIKSALSKERDNVREAMRKVEAFKDSSGQFIDPVKARDALAKVEKLGDMKPDEKMKEQLEAREKQLLEKFDAERKALVDGNADLTKQIHSLLIDSAAVAALAKKKAPVALLLPHVCAMTRVVKDEQGRFVRRVVDKDGRERISMKAGSTSPMDVDELVEEMEKMDEFAPAFPGSGASGTGARPSNGTGGTPKLDRSMSPTERLATHRERQAAGAK
jgi:hypothetical protein